jgi:hypothetical protein
MAKVRGTSSTKRSHPRRGREQWTEEFLDEVKCVEPKRFAGRRAPRELFEASLLFLCAIAGAVVLSGCGLYLHDEAAATQAAAARDAWSKVSAEPNTNAALRNIDAVAKEELKIVEDQARLSLSLALQQVVSMKWNALDVEVLDILRKNVENLAAVKVTSKADADRLQRLKDTFKAAGQALAEAQKAVKTEEEAHPLETAEARLNAAAGKTTDKAAAEKYLALQKALQGRDLSAIVTAEKDFATVAKASPDNELVDTYTKYEEARKTAPAARDLSRVIVELQTAATALTRGLPADLSKTESSLKGTSEAVKKLKTILERVKAESQPGLKLVMLGFAVDVATAERDRIAEQIRQTTDSIKAAERRRDRLALVIVDAAAVLNQIHGNQAYVRDQLAPEMDRTTLDLMLGPRLDQALCGTPGANEPIVITLRHQAERIAADRQAAAPPSLPGGCRYAEQGLEANVLALLRYASLVGYQRYYSRVEQHEAAIASHRGVRREDLINSREREQLISRTLDGLATFYKGGITKEDLARIIAIAEGLAIAVGVNK